MGELQLLENNENELFIHDEFINNYNVETTRRTYKKSLDKFLNFIFDYHKDITTWKDISVDVIIDYRDYIENATGINGEPMAPNSIRKDLAVVSSYFTFLVNKELCDKNPVPTVKKPRSEVIYPTKALTVEQVEELFLSVDSKLSGPLHLALIGTLWLTGMRSSEVLNLRRKDYYKENSDVIIQYKGKGGKFRRKLVHPRLEKIIDDYLQWMKDMGREHQKEDWLFQPSRNNHSPTDLSKQISRSTLHRIIKKYKNKIGLSFNISSHSARATFISVLLDEEVPIIDIAREVAHSSIKTTQEYDKRRKNIKNSLVRKLPF